jgi:hypothetical protein
MPANVKSSRWLRKSLPGLSPASLSRLFLLTYGSVDRPNPGRLVRGHAKAPARISLDDGICFIPSLIFELAQIPADRPGAGAQVPGWTLLAAVLSVLPFTFHRLVSPRLARIPIHNSVAAGGSRLSRAAQTVAACGAATGTGLHTFLILWFAATLVWLWNRESRATTLFLGAGFILAAVCELIRNFSIAALHSTLLSGAIFAWLCLGGALVLSVWALLHPFKKKSWAERPQTVALLQSPFTGNPLHVVSEDTAGKPWSAHPGSASRSAMEFRPSSSRKT